MKVFIKYHDNDLVAMETNALRFYSRPLPIFLPSFGAIRPKLAKELINGKTEGQIQIIVWLAPWPPMGVLSMGLEHCHRGNTVQREKRFYRATNTGTDGDNMYLMVIKAGYSRWMGNGYEWGWMGINFPHSSSSGWMGMNKGWIISSF